MINNLLRRGGGQWDEIVLSELASPYNKYEDEWEEQEAQEDNWY